MRSRRLIDHAEGGGPRTLTIDHEFADFDLFIAGPPVRDVSEAFDLYWNDPWAVPISAFATGDDRSIADAVRGYRATANTEEARVYQKALSSTYIRDIRAGEIPLFPGTAQVFVDDPAKLRTPPSKGPFVVAEALYRAMNKARDEVFVISPYFVPEDYGARFFEALGKRGVRVRVATNSLASTNHAYVHGAYTKYRQRLLAAGVEFLEVRVDAARVTGSADADLTMHTKLVIIDDRWLFVGSPNFDPRSIRQNAEIGMVIDSPELARSIRERVEVIARDYAFTVGRDAGGDTIWRYDGSARQEVFRQEPSAGLLDRLIATLTALLPVESQL